MTSHSDTRRFTSEDKLQAECAILRDENARLRELLGESQLALDVLADDAEEAGYSQRADAAADLAMRCRAALRGGEGGHG